MRRCRLAPLLSFALLAAAPAAAHAGGYEYGTDNGAESVARGGATTASPGLAALYANVAGIADTRFVDIYLTGNLTFRHLWFQRRPGDPSSGETFPAVEDSAPPYFGPMVGVAFRVLPWLSLAVGANGPAAVGWGTFPHGTAEEPGPSRFDVTDTSVLFVWPSIAFGLRIPGLEGLRFGGSFQPSFVHMGLTTYADSGIGAVGDVQTALSLWDPFVPAGQIGVLYRVWRMEMGAQVRLSDSPDAEGEVRVTLHANDAERRDERPTVRGSLRVPWPLAALRAGVRYAHPRAGAPEDELAPPHRRELFDVEVDFVYENNRTVDAFELTIHESVDLGGLEVDVPPRSVLHAWQDTFAVRLGGSVHLLGGDLTISAGGFFESPTVPVAYTRLDYASWTRIGLGAGATYRYRFFEVTLAYQHIFMLDRTVEPGAGRVCPILASGHPSDDVCARAVADGAEQPYAAAVNVGEFRGGYDILALSFGFRL